MSSPPFRRLDELLRAARPDMLRDGRRKRKLRLLYKDQANRLVHIREMKRAVDFERPHYERLRESLECFRRQMEEYNKSVAEVNALKNTQQVAPDEESESKARELQKAFDKGRSDLDIWGKNIEYRCNQLSNCIKLYYLVVEDMSVKRARLVE